MTFALCAVLPTIAVAISVALHINCKAITYLDAKAEAAR